MADYEYGLVKLGPQGFFSNLRSDKGGPVDFDDAMDWFAMNDIETVKMKSSLNYIEQYAVVPKTDADRFHIKLKFSV